jgi:hypothetical protein
MRPAEDEAAIQSQTKCFDFVMYDDTRAGEYLDENPKEHIILTGPPNAEHQMGSNAVCFTRERLKQLLGDPASVYHPCKASASAEYVPLVNWKLIKVALANFTIFVPESDVRSAHKNDACKVFQARPTTSTLERTASKQFVNTSNRFSSDHCQTGTEKLVHRLYPVKFEKSTQ